MKQFGDKGSMSGWMIATIGLIIFSVALSGFGIWSFVNYLDQKNNVDTKISTEVAAAKKTQADTDEAKFTERDKQPNRQFVGPDDYGRVSFDYPKTWSVYIAKDASAGGNYEAYLNPITVPTVSAVQQFALRVVIQQIDYDKVVSGFDGLVKSGSLKSSSIKANGVNGVRLDGSFTKDIRGAEVIFKIRDKTLTLRTDANTFMTDFDALVQTINFNQ